MTICVITKDLYIFLAFQLAAVVRSTCYNIIGPAGRCISVNTFLSFLLFFFLGLLSAFQEAYVA